MNSTEIYKADLSDFLIQGTLGQLNHSSIRDLKTTDSVVGAVIRSRLTPNDRLLLAGARAETAMKKLRDDVSFSFDATAIAPINKKRPDENPIQEREYIKTQKWPFEENAFDVVACTQDFSTLAEPLATLTEFLRITKHGGSLCIVAKCVGQLVVTQDIEGGFETGEKVHGEDLENMVSESGARNVVRIPCTRISQAFLVTK